MIENFERITYELTDEEKAIHIPLLVRGFNTHIGESNAISNRKIRQALSKIGVKISDARMRKLIEYIRVNGIVKCLIATSKGYYIAQTEGEWRSYIRSIDQRINAQETMRDAIFNQGKEIFV